MPPLGIEFAPLPPTIQEAELQLKLSQLQTAAAERAFAVAAHLADEVVGYKIESNPYLTDGQPEGTHTVAWLAVPVAVRDLTELTLSTQVVKDGQVATYSAPRTTYAEFDNFAGRARVSQLSPAY
ncbi:MAG: hypothetical protein ABIQ89_03105, partial [Candidatus Saccharimonadales bacterium]